MSNELPPEAHNTPIEQIGPIIGRTGIVRDDDGNIIELHQHINNVEQGEKMVGVDLYEFAQHHPLSGIDGPHQQVGVLGSVNGLPAELNGLTLDASGEQVQATPDTPKIKISQEIGSIAGGGTFSGVSLTKGYPTYSSKHVAK